MPEKTYTLTELMNNLRERVNVSKHSEGEIRVVGEVVAGILGYDLTDEGYDQFDADLAAAGL